MDSSQPINQVPNHDDVEPSHSNSDVDNPDADFEEGMNDYSATQEKEAAKNEVHASKNLPSKGSYDDTSLSRDQNNSSINQQMQNMTI